MYNREYPTRINMDEQQTLDLYMEYIRAFENKDYQTIANQCRTPFFASSPSGTTIFRDREEILAGFSQLRNSLDIDGYIGSKLNQLDFTRIAETSGTLLVDFHRINREEIPYFHGKALYIFQSKGKKIEIIGIVVLDDSTTSSWND
tara:strand:- start:1805 stop:2242 length:438 start_codon:yes stop_codon:yes gene_type:complete